MPFAGTPRSFSLGSKAQKPLGGASSVTFPRFASARWVGEHKTQVQTNHHLPLPPQAKLQIKNPAGTRTYDLETQVSWVCRLSLGVENMAAV